MNTRKGLILLFSVLIIFSVSQVNGTLEEGYILKWEKALPNKAADVAVFDYDRDYIVNDLAVASWDDAVYIYDKEGDILGVGIGRSSFTSVTSYSSNADKRMAYLAAGSLDDLVYGLWRLYDARYLYADQDRDKVPTGVFWYYNAGDNVQTMYSYDLEGTRYRDYIVFGVGKYFSEKPGTLVVLNSSGVLNWTASVSDVPSAFASADLDGDSFLTHLIVGIGSSATVYDSGGKSVWTHGFGAPVNALSAADLDRDGQLTDILAGAGTGVYAVNAKNKEIWSWESNDTIASISYVDEENDGLIDYYLVASGTNIYALKNTDGEPDVLWKFDTGRNISKHVPIDLDGDLVPDDLGIISGNSLLVYEKAFLANPQLSFTLNSAKDTVEDDTLNLTLSAMNFGEGSATNILMEGTISTLGLGKVIIAEPKLDLQELKPQGSEEFIIPLKDPEPGNYTFDLIAAYKDPYERDKNLSASFTFSVGEAVKTEDDLQLSNSTLFLGLKVGDGDGNSTMEFMNLTIKNLGSKAAKNILIRGNLFKGDDVFMGISATLEELRSRESRLLPFALNNPEEGDYLLNVDIDYQDFYEGAKKINGSFYFSLGATDRVGSDELKNESTVESTGKGTPHIIIERNVSKREISGGEEVEVLITLRNEGDGAALNISYDSTLGEGFTLESGNKSISGSLQQGEDIWFVYTIKPVKKRFRLKSQQYNVTSGVLEYRDSEGKKYLQGIEPEIIEVKRSRTIFILPIVLIVLVVGVGFSRKKANPKNENLEVRFINLYKRYKKEGKAPSYSVLKKELGLDKNEVTALIKKLKSAGKI